MLNKSFIIGLLLLFFAAPVAVMGKDLPDGKWWQRAHMASRLKLTEAEKDSLNQKYIESRRKMIKLKNVLESESFELEVLLDSEPLNEAKTIEQHVRLQKARSDLANERFRFIVEVRKIMGLDRFQELKSVFKKIRRQRARRMLAPAEDRGRKGAGNRQ